MYDLYPEFLYVHQMQNQFLSLKSITKIRLKNKNEETYPKTRPLPRLFHRGPSKYPSEGSFVAHSTYEASGEK